VSAGPTGGSLSLKDAAKGLQLGSSFKLQAPHQPGTARSQPSTARASSPGTSPALTGERRACPAVRPAMRPDAPQAMAGRAQPCLAVPQPLGARLLQE
jgi:hypothetical protein